MIYFANDTNGINKAVSGLESVIDTAVAADTTLTKVSADSIPDWVIPGKAQLVDGVWTAYDPHTDKEKADALMLLCADKVDKAWPFIEGWRNDSASATRAERTKKWLEKYGQLATWARDESTYLSIAEKIYFEVITIGVWIWYNAFSESVWTDAALAENNSVFYFTDPATGGFDSAKTVVSADAATENGKWTKLLWVLQNA